MDPLVRFTVPVERSFGFEHHGAHSELRVSYELPVEVDTADGGRLAFYCHGLTSNLVGYHERHRAAGRLLAERGVSLVRFTESRLWELRNDRESVVETQASDLLEVVRVSLDRAEELCGSRPGTIMLAGFSAGGGACMLALSELPVTHLLLIAPSSERDEYRQRMLENLAGYDGRLLIVHGEADDVIPIADSVAYLDAARTSDKRFVRIPECDHLFDGDENERSFIESFSDAFS